MDKTMVYLVNVGYRRFKFDDKYEAMTFASYAFAHMVDNDYDVEVAFKWEYPEPTETEQTAEE